MKTATKPRFKNVETKIEEAINGMDEGPYRIIECEVPLGFIKLPDGRKVKVTIRVDADQDNW